MEFVTSDTCVTYFLARVKFSGINAKNCPFCKLCRIQAKVFTKQLEWVCNFAQKLIICSKLINKTSSLLTFWPKMLRFTLFSWVKLFFVESYCCKKFDKFVVCAAYQLDLGIKINSQTCLGHFVLLKHCQTHTKPKLAKALKDYTKRWSHLWKALKVLSLFCLFGSFQSQVHKPSW